MNFLYSQLFFVLMPFTVAVNPTQRLDFSLEIPLVYQSTSAVVAGQFMGMQRASTGSTMPAASVALVGSSGAERPVLGEHACPRRLPVYSNVVMYGGGYWFGPIPDIAAGISEANLANMQVIPAGDVSSLAAALARLAHDLPSRRPSRYASDDWGRMVAAIETIFADLHRTAK